jgi:hypothetical protein
MGDMGEIFNSMREEKQKKRRSNTAYSTRQLQDEGIEFVSCNGGIHLQLAKGNQAIDYWPSTGLWWIRGTRNKRRGIAKLISYMKAPA